MRLLLALHPADPARSVDPVESAVVELVVDVAPGATVAELAAQLFATDPRVAQRPSDQQPGHQRPAHHLPGDQSPGLTLEVLDGGAAAQVLNPALPVEHSGLLSGSAVRLATLNAGSAATVQQSPVASITVVAGPDAGASFAVAPGTARIGRSAEADIRLQDPLVSALHATLVVSDRLTLVDTNSANGLVLAGAVVERAELHSGDEVVIGGSTVRIRFLHQSEPAVANPHREGGYLDFTRSPRVIPASAPPVQHLPDPPPLPSRAQFPVLMLFAPVLLAVVMFFATASSYALLFVLLMPVLLLAGYFDGKLTGRRALKTASREFFATLAQTDEHLVALANRERAARCAASPSAASCIAALRTHGPLLFSTPAQSARAQNPPAQNSPVQGASPDRSDASTAAASSGFLQLRLGVGEQKSSIILDSGTNHRTTAAAQAALDATQAAAATVSDVPVTSSLRDCGALGLAGEAVVLDGVVRGILLQALTLHSPAELVVTALLSAEREKEYAWLRWLPHAHSPQSPLRMSHIAFGQATTQLLSELETLVAHRRAQVTQLPAVLVLIQSGVIPAPRLNRLAQDGPAVGVHLIVLADAVRNLPALCQDFLSVAESGSATFGSVGRRELTQPVTCEPVDLPTATHCAMLLAPLRDAGAALAESTGLPARLGWLQAHGFVLAAATSSAVQSRWLENNSVTSHAVARDEQPLTLRALVGATSSGAHYLDLVADGPHALVGGTTGSGKSEFLQSWVLDMAAAYSPDRLAFLFIDYKGGAAFAQCTQLPHSVGLVTDLSGHLVDRVMASLRAELLRREKLLRDRGAKDLAQMHHRQDPHTPPALVIVVDEFSTLATEMPHFVDGMVDLAARGRSLGLHLILATQRPAGVIKENLRANTNLRIALRLADEEDSLDVLGHPLAAHFSPETPGRAAVKTGPRSAVVFQAAYAGAASSIEAMPAVRIRELASGAEWHGAGGQQHMIQQPGALQPAAQEAVAGKSVVQDPSDLQTMVGAIGDAARQLRISAPRRPWLDGLATSYDLRRLAGSGQHAAGGQHDGGLTLGMLDDPARQWQGPLVYHPERSGNLAIMGAPGSGKSAALRSVALAAALADPDAEVYGIDAAASGLRMIAGLPHVGHVLDAQDTERVSRLLDRQCAELRERQNAFATVHAGSLSEYRLAHPGPALPRTYLLVDALGAFREQCTASRGANPLDALTQLAAEGSSFGIHVVVSAEGPRALPAALAGSFGARLVLRQSSSDDYSTFGVQRDVLSTFSPPGRALAAGTLVPPLPAEGAVPTGEMSGAQQGRECQLAIPGGSASLAEQSTALAAAAEALLAGGVPSAPSVPALPEDFPASRLPKAVPGDAVVGLADANLQPLSTHASGTLMLAGPPGSGRTTALLALAESLRVSAPEVERIFIAPRPSLLAARGIWQHTLIGSDELQLRLPELLKSLTGHVAVFIEALTDFTASNAEGPLASFIQAALREQCWVVAESETSTWSGAWTLAAPFKAGRRGVILNPGSLDGESLLNTPLGRIYPQRFIPGRGYLVARGSALKVQLPNSAA